jgi:hypothetical protein
VSIVLHGSTMCFGQAIKKSITIQSSFMPRQLIKKQTTDGLAPREDNFNEFDDSPYHHQHLVGPQDMVMPKHKIIFG